MPIKSVDSASVNISTDYAQADPGATLFPDGKRILLHLTRHARELIAAWDRRTNTNDIDETTRAITISGKVNVRLMSDVDNITPVGFSVSGWDFHFMQVVRDTTYATYAGRSASEGYVLEYYTNAPAFEFSMRWCLDSDRSLPFYNPKTPDIAALFRYNSAEAPRHPGHEAELLPGVRTISTHMNDHPAWANLLKFSSRTTSPGRGREFLLYRVVKVFEARAVFVARNEQGVIQPLASVGWSANWDVSLRWRNNRPSVFVDKHLFNVDRQWVKGPPGDNAQASIISHPTTDVARTANAALDRATRSLEIGVNQRPPNVIFVDRWSSDIPRDFYR